MDRAGGSCPICSGTNTENITLYYESGQSDDRWTYCHDCDLFFVRNMPDSEDEFQKYASGEYRGDIVIKWAKRAGRTPEQVAWVEIINEAMRAQHMIMVMEENEFVPMRFLDVGASQGILALAVKASWKDCEVWGVEPFTANVGADKVYDDLKFVQSMDEVMGTFNVITCIHTLEHIPNPVEFLSKIAEHLEPDGHLLIEVPCYDKEVPGTNPFHKDHVFTYTLRGLGSVLERAGLKPVHYRYHGHLFHLGTHANLLMHVRRAK